ncbi:MAG: tail fiber protein, partial [Verrucomicrobiaceae bacterium]
MPIPERVSAIENLLKILVPIGTVLAYAGRTAPQGFLFCDGQPYDQNDNKYKPLFDVIGTNHGASNGLFNV